MSPQILETICEHNDEFMHKYLESVESITTEEIVKNLRDLTLNFKVVPVLCGSAKKNKGVQTLLDAVGRMISLNKSFNASAIG